MIFCNVRNQLSSVFERAIETGVSVSQNFPSIVEDGNTVIVGQLKSTAIALKDIPYPDIYNDLEKGNQYHIKLPDGGLLLFQYEFNGNKITKHRLCYFPCPLLPSVEEAPELYDKDELYADILSKRIVRFPIRFDFDPKNYRPTHHPHSHMTLGQFENCRIPVSHAVSPDDFLKFILRNFYSLMYKRHMNKFEKRMIGCRGQQCITSKETMLPYLSL